MNGSGPHLACGEGRFSKAAEFDGLSGSEIKVPDDPELEVGSGEFTIEAWIKPDEEALGTDIMAVASKWIEVEGSEARSYLLRVNADGKLEGKVYGSGDETATVVSEESLSEALSDKEWVHVAMERNADDELSLWVDRVKQVDVATFTATVADENEAFRVGAAGNVVEGEEADGMYFVGLIDEVRLSKTARGAAGKLCSVQINYSHNARNQLVTETSGVSTKTYSYDNNGNTTGIVEKVGTVEVASVSMEYDALNRMTSYTGPEGTETFGYRGAEWHRFSADGTSFLYDGDNVLADINAGNIHTLYVTSFLDENLSMTRDSPTYYFSQDGLGSVRTITDSSGSIKNTYDYTPFGRLFAPRTSVTVEQRHRFRGRESSAGAPMYFRYRHYGPSVGRMYNRNPWGVIQGRSSLYDALGNKPVRYGEPFSWLVMDDAMGVDTAEVNRELQNQRISQEHLRVGTPPPGYFDGGECCCQSGTWRGHGWISGVNVGLIGWVWGVGAYACVGDPYMEAGVSGNDWMGGFSGQAFTRYSELVTITGVKMAEDLKGKLMVNKTLLIHGGVELGAGITAAVGESGETSYASVMVVAGIGGEVGVSEEGGIHRIAAGGGFSLRAGFMTLIWIPIKEVRCPR